MDTVQIINAGLIQYYSFASPPNAPQVISTTANIVSNPMPKDGIYATYQLTVTGVGAVTATGLVQCTNDPYTAGADDRVNQKFQNFAMGTTTTSTSVTQANGYFRQDQTGNQVYAVGVPNGTTFTYVSPTTGTLSANATATGNVQARFQANKWVTLGTITLTGTTEVSDGFATASSWKWTRITTSNVTGTNATVQAIQGN